MAFDGIVTHKVVQELKSLIGYKIDKVFEPDKNTIILGLYGKSSNFSLLLCTSSNNCRIHLTTHNQKNPLIAPNFCMLLRKHLIGLKIKNIYTVDLERIVFIDLENNENPNKPIQKRIIIELMGRHSNIIITDVNGIIIDSMRHTSTFEHSTRDIYPTSRYKFLEAKKYSFLELKDFDDFYLKIEPQITELIVNQIENISDLDISNFNLDKIISNTFNGLSKSFVQNIIIELGISSISKESLKLLYDKINEIIYSGNLDVVFNDTFSDYYLYTCKNELQDNYNINFKLDNFYFSKELDELFKNYRNSILNLILALLKKYEKRLENIDIKLKECEEMNTYRIYGELITANLYKIPNKNTDNVTLENYYDNNKEIKIPLNKEFSPSVNAKRYFKKYSKLKNALQVVTIQKQETIRDIDYIESVIFELESSKTLEDVEEIYEEISENSIFENILKKKNTNRNNKKNTKPKNLTKNKLTSFNPLKYVIDGYTILVGRNNKENDYLTCKFAKKSDIWFHTKDIHGSHVILKTEGQENTPYDILFEAAKLAAKHSKAKNSSHVPVDYCKISFVKKPSGSKPGYVIYSNNKTIYV